MSEQLPDPGEPEHPLGVSFQLTEAFLRRHPGYRQKLALTPEHFRFDPVLWNSSLAALRGLLRSVSEEEGIDADQAAIETAVHNLIEGVIARSAAWDPGPSAPSEEN